MNSSRAAMNPRTELGPRHRAVPLLRTSAGQGDPGRLRRVVLNLAGNAIDYRKSVRITVGLGKSGDPAHVRLFIVVEDTGIGIPKDKIDLLFASFQQVDVSTSRRFGGTGLGLAISKHLVTMMHGEIGV